MNIPPSIWPWWPLGKQSDGVNFKTRRKGHLVKIKSISKWRWINHGHDGHTYTPVVSNEKELWIMECSYVNSHAYIYSTCFLIVIASGGAVYSFQKVQSVKESDLCPCRLLLGHTKILLHPPLWVRLPNWLFHSNNHIFCWCVIK